MTDVQRIWLNKILDDQKRQSNMKSRTDGVRARVSGRMASKRRRI